MQSFLLTSSGFDNRNISLKLRELIGKSFEYSKVLFIPTASMKSQNYEYINLCRQELIDIGVLDSSIFSYNLDYTLSRDIIREFDFIYVCGGNTQDLFEAMENINFKAFLTEFFTSDRVYVGVSAGSIVLNYLGYFTSRLEVHCVEGSSTGLVEDHPTNCINLTDSQAIFLNDEIMELFE